MGASISKVANYICKTGRAPKGVQSGQSGQGPVLDRSEHLPVYRCSFWWDFPTKNHQNLDGSAFAPKWVAPEDEQEPYESHRLWHDLIRALLVEDMDAATAAKGAVENAQRELCGATAKHATHFFKFRDNHSAPRIQCAALPP
jgi:hypothetical protein